MQVTTLQDRTLTELDHVRITRLIERAGASAPSPAVEAVLDMAELVSSRSVPSDVVTMCSRVRVADPQGGEERVLTLCYPHEADAAAGCVSVLSPVGAALLGLRVGAMARWRTPDGREAVLEIREILYQPEASGDFTR